MTKDQNKAVVPEDEISLKDLILKFWEYFYHLLRNWKIIGAFVLLGFLFNVCKYFTHTPKYIATISFMINEDESSSLGGLSSILGSFGGLLSGSSEYNLDKVLEISQSNIVAEGVLLNKIEVNGTHDYIGNHIIESLDTLNEWIDIKWYDRFISNVNRKKQQKEFRFTKDTINYNDIIETYVLKRLSLIMFGQKQVNQDGLITSSYGELTGIMNIEAKTYHQKLSLEVTNLIFEILRSFYIEKSIEKQQQTFDIMKVKHDSINQQLQNYEYSLARFEDANRGLFKIKDQVKKDQLRREIIILATALGEAKKNLEISDFALKDKTPFIQVINKPFLPLNNTRPSLIKTAILGPIFGGILGIFLIIISKIYREIMAHN